MPDAPNIQYLRIENWGDHIHPDTKRKAKPPFRWIKLATENLDMLGDLTLREYGAYCRLLSIAASTDNSTVYKPSWIRRRTGITQKDIEKLMNRGLIQITNELHDSEKNQQNQRNDVNSASKPPTKSPQSAAPEGKGGDRNRSELNRGDMRREDSASSLPLVLTREVSPPKGIRPNGRQPDFSELTEACLAEGVSGSDWNGIQDVIKLKYGFLPTEKQLNTLQRQLNDRAGK